jgi:hypothetical protein
MLHPLLLLGRPVGLLSEGAGPTRAYWLGGLESPQGADAWIEFNPRCRPQPADLEAIGALVVVRTIPRAWLSGLRQLRAQGKPVVLLLDDALLGSEALADLPLLYRWRLWWGISRHRTCLGVLITELWVSTAALADQCRQELGPHAIPIKVLPLRPALGVVATQKAFRIAYLGTASHSAELTWLLPLLAQLQRLRSDCLVELVLNRSWRRRFRHLPRTRIFYPMDWETYRMDTGNRSVDLLLVPLLPTAFNSGRAAVKFFDAARLGAVGLYSDRTPYKGFVRNGIDGQLLPDSPGAWLEAIDALLRDQGKRQQLAAGCRKRALQLCSG